MKLKLFQATLDTQDYVPQLKALQLENIFEESPYIDIRLREFEGEIFLHWGDSQYDTDHRGFWGYGTLHRLDSEKVINRHLIEMAYEIRDQVAMIEMEKMPKVRKQKKLKLFKPKQLTLFPLKNYANPK